MLCIANRNQGILIRGGRFRISPTKGESKVGLWMLGKGGGRRKGDRHGASCYCVLIFLFGVRATL